MGGLASLLQNTSNDKTRKEFGVKLQLFTKIKNIKYGSTSIGELYLKLLENNVAKGIFEKYLIPTDCFNQTID